MDKLASFLKLHKTTVILVVILGLSGGLGWLGYQKFLTKPATQVEEVGLPFDAEGPYALLHPRRDGNALVLNLKRTASYNSITYELAYTSKAEEMKVAGGKTDEGDLGKSGSLGIIDRGVQGTIDTKDKKGEYEQEILFGTCSKNVCKYDKGVENGTLTLHIKKDEKAYKMITQWHLQKPDIALGILTSGDEHLVYKINVDREELTAVGFSIINDLSGVPKLPSGKDILGKVYALNVPIAKQLPGGDVTLEQAENIPAEAKLARYDDGGNKWVELDTKINGSKLSAKADSGGIFAVLVPRK